MSEVKPYYRILQVDRAAEPEVITAAYKRLALKYHPDSNRAPDALQRMQEINEAYEVLSDPVKRERYNLLLSGQPVYGEAHDRHGPEAGTGSPWASARSPANRVEVDETTQRANQQLGCSFMVVYGMVTLLLFRLAYTRLTSLWMIVLIFILAGLITIPVVFKIDDLLKKKF